jgi:1-acyl-sn-glycerol-3-phosphate acyltransferase
MGAVEVTRNDRRKAYKALNTAVEALQDGYSVVIFPEGTWGDRKGRMRRFRRGVAVMAQGSGAPVVPVTIVGSNKVNPPFTMELYPGTLKLVIHPPLSAEELRNISETEALDRLRTIIAGPLEYGVDMATPPSCERAADNV